MREILFRGKFIDNGEWVEGYLFIDKVNSLILKPVVSGDKNGFEFNSVFEDTVSEFTGLTDKNGKRIFEGDIVKWIANGITHIDEVSFVHGKFNAGDFPLFMVTLCNAEVIGNKWDNPELLKEE